jgi:hypothetical protein
MVVALAWVAVVGIVLIGIGARLGWWRVGPA